VDLLALFIDFYNGSLDIKCFNYGIIILIAKGQGADNLQMYRPICLLNVIFKKFTKVLNNRAIALADKVISSIQSTFIKGRFILDNVTVLHETLHYMHRRKKAGGLFKVDFEKAYDKINWDFMFSVLDMKGFPELFVKWTKDVVNNGKVCIMVNDELGPYFQTRKGLRQGDPFSPLLFNIDAYVLSVLVKRAQENGLVTGLASVLLDDGIAIIQYVDDTIFMFEDSLESLVI
jgi:hypothetical protein